MEIKSTNIAQPVSIRWKGETQVTGIYKTPQPEGIYLTREGVRGDTIGNPRVHGDRLKACYLFNTGEYPHWKARYPHLEWGYGMFGENLSVEGLDENTLKIGSVYKVGEVLLRVTAPREPCFKLGIRFGDQGIIERFIAHGKPGSYVEVLSEGWVKPGDSIELQESAGESMSIAAFYKLLFSPSREKKELQAALALPVLSESSRKKLERWFQA